MNGKSLWFLDSARRMLQLLRIEPLLVSHQRETVSLELFSRCEGFYYAPEGSCATEGLVCTLGENCFVVVLVHPCIELMSTIMGILCSINPMIYMRAGSDMRKFFHELYLSM